MVYCMSIQIEVPRLKEKKTQKEKKREGKRENKFNPEKELETLQNDKASSISYL